MAPGIKKVGTHRLGRSSSSAGKEYIATDDATDRYNFGDVLLENETEPPPWHERPWLQANTPWTEEDESQINREALTKRHQSRPLHKDILCIYPAMKIWKNYGKAAAYLRFATVSGYLTWLDTECARLLKPYGQERKNGWPNSATGTVQTHVMVLRLLETAVDHGNDPLEEILKAVEPGVLMPVPARICGGKDNDQRNDICGLVLAACSTLLHYATNGDDKKPRMWFGYGAGLDGGRLFLGFPLEDWNRAYVAMRAYFERRMCRCELLGKSERPGIATPVPFFMDD